MNHNITLALAAENEIPYLKEKVAESFSIAVREHFGDNTPEGGPPAEQLEDAYREADSRVYKIMKDGLPFAFVTAYSSTFIPDKDVPYK